MERAFALTIPAVTVEFRLNGLPYTFVMGKKLKKGPESYEDVREAVVKDYLTVYEDAWLKDLKRKYKVEINQEVLKTVNNNGSN